MRKFVLWLFVAMTLLAGTQLFAQNPHYNNGPVWRVIYVNVKTGMGDAYLNDLSQHFSRSTTSSRSRVGSLTISFAPIRLRNILMTGMSP